MPRVTLTQNDFTAGEFDPRLYGRSDIEKYRSGAESLNNGLVLPYGGVKKRPGTVHVANTKYPERSVRLMRYVFNRDQAYCLEFGHLYIRFFTGSGQITSGTGAYEIESPYSEDELDDLSFAQTGDVLFIAHGSHPLQRLTRLAHDLWTIKDVQFVQEPVVEQDWYPPYTLTLSTNTVGASRTATAPVFCYTDYSSNTSLTRRIYSVGGGEAYITTYPTTQLAATITIVKEFESTTISPDDWWMSGQPQCNAYFTNSSYAAITTPSGWSVGENYYVTSQFTGTGIVAPTVGAAIAISTAAETTLDGKEAVVFGFAAAHGLTRGQMFKATDTASGLYYVLIAGAVTTTTITAVSLDYPTMDISTLDNIVLLTHSTQYGFRAHDVGGALSLPGGGVCKITDIRSPGQIAVQMTKVTTSNTAPPANSWAILRRVWGGSAGYPKAVTIFEQRMVLAGSDKFPNSVWFSRIGDFLDFSPSTDDDGAMTINISADEMADIRHLAQAKALIALSTTGEFTFVGGVEKPITPTNIQVKNQSPYGCNGVRPQRIGNELFFVQRSGKKLRAMAYKYDSDAFGSPDLSVMSSHITDLGIVDMTYQPEPYGVLWCVLSNGDIGCVTIERDQNVIAWTTCETTGSFENVCSIPYSGYDRVWAVVSRTVSGATLRSVVYFDDDVYQDSTVYGTSSPATDVWSGLDHLEGLTVSVKADGVYNGTYTVSGGSVTLNRTANSVYIGLPFTMSVVPLTPELMTGEGSAVGNAMRVSAITARFHQSIGATINGDDVYFVQFGDVLDEAPALFSGLKEVGNLGWGKGSASVTISNDWPYPLHILSITYKFTVNS